MRRMFRSILIVILFNLSCCLCSYAIDYPQKRSGLMAKGNIKDLLALGLSVSISEIFGTNNEKHYSVKMTLRNCNNYETLINTSWALVGKSQVDGVEEETSLVALIPNISFLLSHCKGSEVLNFEPNIEFTLYSGYGLIGIINGDEKNGVIGTRIKII